MLWMWQYALDATFSAQTNSIALQCAEQCIAISYSPHCCWLIFSSWIGHVLLKSRNIANLLMVPIISGKSSFKDENHFRKLFWCLFGQIDWILLFVNQEQFCCRLLGFLAAITNWCSGNFEEERRPGHLSVFVIYKNWNQGEI